MRMICLANSKKLGGRCVAGIELTDQKWVRPVHRREGGEFYLPELEYDGGGEMELLDVFEFEPLADAASLYHPEDVLAEGTWQYVGAATADDLAVVDQMLELGPDILGSTSSSIAKPTRNDDALDSSLAVVRPEGRVVFHKDRNFGNLRCRVRFSLSGQRYDLPVTDPVISATMAELDDGDYAPDDIGAAEQPYLTISLGEPFQLDGKCYKLVAAVFPR